MRIERKGVACSASIASLWFNCHSINFHRAATLCVFRIFRSSLLSTPFPYTTLFRSNFNVAVLKEGVERLVLGFDEHRKRTAETRWTHKKKPAKAPEVPSLNSMTNCGDAATEQLAREIIAGAKEVNRELGPGLRPSAY